MIDGTFRVKQGQVVFVNKIKWTCTVKFDDGTPTEHVAVAPIYLNKGGNGIYFVPEVDSHVLVAFTDNKTFLLSVSYPTDMEKSVESAEDTNDEFDLEPDHSAQRPMLREGDVAITSSGGAFVQVAGSGLVEIGASQVSKRQYIPISNFIRDFCESYLLETFGGRLSFRSLEGDPSHGVETVNVKVDPNNPDAPPVPITIQKSPVVFDLSIKEYAEDVNDMIKLSMGRIKASGAPNVALPLSPGKDYDHTALIEFNVNDRFTFYLDKYGTVLKTVKGNVVESYGADLLQKVVGNKKEVIKASYTVESGNFSIKSAGNLSTSSRGNKNTTILGSETTEIGKNQSETVQGLSSSTYGRREQLTKGSMTSKVLGNSSFSVGGRHSESIAEAHSVVYGDGSKSDVVSGDYEVLCATGSVDIRASVVGSAKLSCFEASEVVLSNTRASVNYIPAGSGLEANATGSGVFSSGGAVSVDSAGTVSLGASTGAAGAVITTATNPVCFVTGLPLMGAANITAKSTVPSPSPIPSTYNRG